MPSRRGSLRPDEGGTASVGAPWAGGVAQSRHRGRCKVRSARSFGRTFSSHAQPARIALALVDRPAGPLAARQGAGYARPRAGDVATKTVGAEPAGAVRPLLAADTRSRRTAAGGQAGAPARAVVVAGESSDGPATGRRYRERSWWWACSTRRRPVHRRSGAPSPPVRCSFLGYRPSPLATADSCRSRCICSQGRAGLRA